MKPFVTFEYDLTPTLDCSFFDPCSFFHCKT